MKVTRSLVHAAASAAALTACTAGGRGPLPSDSASLGERGLAKSGARLVAVVADLHGPESVRYDAEQDVYFISNMLGYGSVADGNGYIVRVKADDPTSAVVFAAGDSNGVTLDAPKGLAIQGDTLWTTDIKVIRGFNRYTGAPVATIDLSGRALLLNDIALGGDGYLYVTDTGIILSDKGVLYRPGNDKIFRIGPGRAVEVMASGTSLDFPNGVTWNGASGQLLVVTFDAFGSQLYTMKPGDSTHTQLARGKGRFDGVEVLKDGRIVFTCWNDSSVHAFANGKDEQIIRNVPMPADLGVDTRRNRLAIPVDGRDRVEIWQLPPDADDRRPGRVAAR